MEIFFHCKPNHICLGCELCKLETGWCYYTSKTKVCGPFKTKHDAVVDSHIHKNFSCEQLFSMFNIEFAINKNDKSYTRRLIRVRVPKRRVIAIRKSKELTKEELTRRLNLYQDYYTRARLDYLWRLDALKKSISREKAVIQLDEEMIDEWTCEKACVA